MYARRLLGAFVLLLLASCVTINIYFPAAAAERAADRIIEDVWGEQPGGGRSPGDATPSESPNQSSRAVLRTALDVLVPAARAQSMDLNISTPAIDKITASMKARHPELLPYYESGAIGLTGQGLVAIRDPKTVPLAERRQLNQLVADENRDRSALYREIAQANGHPEWEDEIRKTFARRWIENAPRGWWYRQNGAWKQK